MDLVQHEKYGDAVQQFEKVCKKYPSFLATYLKLAEAFLLEGKEAEAVAGLSHPAIVPIYEIGETPDFRWFTMQLIEGEPLAAPLWIVEAAGRRVVLVGHRISPGRPITKRDGTVVRIAEDTHYPFEETVRFTVKSGKPVEFPLYFRLPGWCKQARFPGFLTPGSRGSRHPLNHRVRL